MLVYQRVISGNFSEQLTGAFYAGNGWVAGGCWDDH